MISNADSPVTLPDPGQRHRDAAAIRSRRLSVQAADIGTPPKRNDELWERYRHDLFLYLCECFPHSTGLKPFSLDHKRIIDRTQQIILEGGLELFVVFRGFAKSTITENSATWGAGYGHRIFFVPIAANDEMARTALDSIQAEFETNDFLLEIFPEACHAARALEGVPQRAGKQTIGGELTHIEWTGERCVLPSVAGFPGSGAIIWPKGITSNIRGLRFKRPDGTQSRPDFVMGDDLQTDDSAASPAQVAKRLSKLNKTILRLGGHNKAMACVVNGTIIEPDDAIDQLSNSKVYPAWRTTKVPMLKSLSKNQDTLWLDKYAEIRTTHNPEDDDDRGRALADATKFYETHREEMDKGAEASWSHCYIDDQEISAIQHAYNILIDTTYDAFMSECQSEPYRDTGGLLILTPDEMAAKQSGYGRDQFPQGCAVLTAFVDVHPSILYWEIWAWEPRFTGYCVNYGTFPEQKRKYFSHTSLAVKLQKLFPGYDADATITAGLSALLHGDTRLGVNGLLMREWQRADGVPMRIVCAGIDANGEASGSINKFIRQSKFAASLYPSYGKGIGATTTPMSQWQQARGGGMGPEWVTTKGKPGSPAGIIFDTNYWKTRFHRGLALPNGSQGALYLFKDKPENHRRIADHWYSERPKEATSGSRTVYQFSQKPGTDNHDLDCAVGNMVAASRCGIASFAAAKPRKRRKVKYL